MEDEQPSTRGAKRVKNSKACIACRNTKTKCIPAETGDSCEACLRKSRPCVAPGPGKPRMKSSEKFHELERKIESLTSALAAKDQPQTPPESRPSRVSTSEEFPEDNICSIQDENIPTRPRLQHLTPSFGSPDGTASISRSQDVIEQGYIDVPTAEVLLNHYNISLRPILPIIDLSQEKSVDQMRKSKPMLFLAVLAVSSASILPSFEPRLVMELNEQLARHTFILGTQSLDIVQAMLLFSHYYIRPSNSQNIAQTLYVSSAVAMSYNLFLHRRTGRASVAESQERRDKSRTWLACWYSASR